MDRIINDVWLLVYTTYCGTFEPSHAKYMIDNPSSIVFSNLDTQILRVMWFGLTPKSYIGIRHVFKHIIDLMLNHDDHSKLDG
jgi:hypothetical protein